MSPPGEPGSRFVEVPKEAMVGFLEGCGFKPVPGRGTELVYERPHHNHGDLRVRVYTSIGFGSTAARGCGEDAIRVVLVWQPPHRIVDGSKPRPVIGVGTTKKILRTGTVEGVLARLDVRMRECYLMVGPMCHRRCRTCQAPTYYDSGRCVDKACQVRAGMQGFDPKGR